MQEVFCTKADGYRGIWWGQTPTQDEYAFKYSGGLATYPVQHHPFAVYCGEVKKTFFVWGGTTPGSHRRTGDRDTRWDFGPGELLQMVSVYDHRTGQVPRPTVIFDKWTADPHDNPVIAVDEAGFIWVFSPSHGLWTTPSFIHRSTVPYSIERFETVSETLFAYPQVRWVAGNGLVFFHTRYGTPEVGEGRGICFSLCPRGGSPDEYQVIANLQRGHYQCSAVAEDRIATAFDLHPWEGGLEARTNLYYLESPDFGVTWRTADGRDVRLPVNRADHECLVRDFQAEGLLVYIKDLVFDHAGRPVIHYVTSRGWRPGPESGPHQWWIAHWTGSEWKFHFILASDNNYDMGSLYLESETCWRILGTSGAGPQAFNPGGEVESWISADEGHSWTKEHACTANSPFNHNHVRRPVEAHPEFSAFWADGHARHPSESRLYFADGTGRVVRRLPVEMSGDFATPERVFF